MLLNFLRSSFAVLILSVLLLITSCTPKISKIAIHNRFVKNFNNHIINDSLQLHFISPADITYLTTKKSIKQAINQYQIKVSNEVLLVGTAKSPNYQFLITMGSKKEQVNPKKLVLDTVINGKEFHLIGNYQNKTDEQTVTADIKKIFDRLKAGKNYLQELSSVMDIVNGAMNKNLFLKTLSEIKQFEIPKNQRNSLEMQMQLTYSSFLGNNDIYKNLITQQEQFFKPQDSIVNVITNNKIGNNLALAAIVKLAKSTNMLMINENHYYPSHRLLVLALLPQLKEAGYTHLALEALGSPADSLLNLPLAYPKLTTGFYSMEQNYSNLLREAKKLGFQFVAYENTDSKKDREIGQAENLYTRTIGKNKNAKVLVIAGVDHILEIPSTNGKKWMATLIKENYHINPITISQTHLNSYRNYSQFKYQLFAKEELKDIKSIAAVDYFILNNQIEPVNLWDSIYKYQNKHQQTVQISLFYQKEMKNDFDYQLNIPYFTRLLVSKQSYSLPFNRNEKALMVVYDHLGTVLEKTLIN